MWLSLRFSGNDGSSPTGALTQGRDGYFYGTTAYGGDIACGGSGGCGAVFKISSSGNFSTLYTFCLQAQCSDGSAPDMGVNGLLLATNGHFYGVTQFGGNSNAGTIFEITSDGKLTTIHSFSGSDGGQPWAAPIQITNGNLYGTTASGGTKGCSCGTIYRVDMGLGPFVSFVQPFGKIGQIAGILGQSLTGTTSVKLNGDRADFRVISDTFIKATVPKGAKTGYVTVTTPSGPLKSNVPFHVTP